MTEETKTKICNDQSVCKIRGPQPETNFHWRKKDKGIRSNSCSLCYNTSWRKKYGSGAKGKAVKSSSEQVEKANKELNPLISMAWK